MLIEGIQLYLKVTRVFTVHLNMPLCYLSAWGKFVLKHGDESPRELHVSELWARTLESRCLKLGGQSMLRYDRIKDS